MANLLDQLSLEVQTYPTALAETEQTTEIKCLTFSHNDDNDDDDDDGDNDDDDDDGDNDVGDNDDDRASKISPTAEKKFPIGEKK